MSIPDREAIAREEAGKTDVSRPVSIFVVVSFWLILLGGGGWWLAQRLWGQQAPSGAALADTSSGTGIWSRALSMNYRLLARITEFENRFNQHSPIATRFVPPVQYLLTRFLRTGNEKVYVGRDHWLYYRPGMDYLTGPGFLQDEVLARRRRTASSIQEEIFPNPVTAILEMKAELDALQIALIVVPAPTKAMVNGAPFVSLHGIDGDVNNADYGRFTQLLEDAGVHVVHPHELAKAPAAQPFFLKTDSHWTPLGMSLTAQAIARQIQKLTGQKAAGTGDDAPRYMKARQSITATGDLAAMLKVEDYLKLQDKVTIEHILTREGALWQPDRQGEVLLLGDSFSNMYSLEGMGWGSSAGLAEHVSYYLNRPVDAIRINDNGAYATRQYLSTLQQKGQNRLAGKKVVVYEFAIRELASGNWKTGLSLKSMPRQSTRLPLAAPGKRVRVHGKIAMIKPVASAKESTYRDCLIPLLMTDVTIDGASAPTDRLLVYVWGMLDGELTSYNGLPAGARLDVELAPFEQMESAVGSYRRLDFADGELMLLDAYIGDFRMPGKKSLPARAPNASSGVSDSQTPASAAVAANRSGESESTKRLVDAATTLVQQSSAPVVTGQDGWMFLHEELRHLAKGQFWGPQAARVSASENDELADPLPAILDFQRQLTALGIELVIVPVPPKAVVYPGMLTAGLADLTDRPDGYLQQFYRLLREAGVTVVDLTDVFDGQAGKGAHAMYCREDSHWSSAGCQVAAKEIAKVIVPYIDRKSVPRAAYFVQAEKTLIDGDLWRRLTKNRPAQEVLTVFRVSSEKDRFVPVESWKDSPVLLLGDSHTLVFHAGGDMLATGAGLADHLAHELGFAVDVMGVRGSGATLARVSLLRRDGGLLGKKVVVWCFTARDFTEATSGWALVPVSRQAPSQTAGK